ncbi:MAG: SCO family protein [Acidimicrobiales bacterium]|jgi:cytochrome oxidase Cu insertion factor (SCO1/SenC/PrrC family)
MPGMNAGLHTNSPTVVAAFHRTLLHQGLVVVLLIALLLVAWNVLRTRQLRIAGDAVEHRAGRLAALSAPEPLGRRVLRVSFGLLWILDGILQGQSSMPLGMAPQVLQPAAASSPTWVQHVDNVMATIWSYHPISLSTAAVWIQIGIGVLLLVAPRGTWSRLAGVASVGWGLAVWVFGEAFGQVFAPGQSWLFGLPGAVLFYCVAGALVALPERSWSTPRLGRAILRVMGAFFVGMALLQAWPGRGFWHGQASPRTTAGTLTSMLQQMAHSPQPPLLASWLSAFAAFDAAHGWGVNLVVVLVLAAVGITLLSARPGLVRVGVVVGIVLCLATWVLVQDLGVLGGVGTDPNSMIPTALLFFAGYLALTRVPDVDASTVVAIGSTPAARRPLRERLALDPTYAVRSAAALCAVGIVLVGVVPGAAAAADPHASPILAEAINGSPQATNAPAPLFHLIDQYGRPVALSRLRGKAVAVTFLDPVCTSACPTIAQELRDADELLGNAASKVELVAIDANPRYVTTNYLQAFDEEEHLTSMRNWLYLTGATPAKLRRAWRAFGAYSALSPAGAMVAHSELVDVIGPDGRLRYLLNADPGPGTEATQSSFSVLLATTLRKVLSAP